MVWSLSGCTDRTPYVLDLDADTPDASDMADALSPDAADLPDASPPPDAPETSDGNNGVHPDAALPDASVAPADADVGPIDAGPSSAACPGGWVDEVVATGLYGVGIPGGNPSLALDAADHAHILFDDGEVADTSLSYRSNETGTWGTGWGFGAVDCATDSIGIVLVQPNSIAIDASGVKHVVYYADCDAPGPHGVYYATEAPGGGWTEELIDATGGFPTNVVLGIDGMSRFVYYASGVGSLYMVLGPSGWTSEVLPFAAGEGQSLAIDSVGNAHLVPGYPAGELRHATNASGSWVEETIDASVAPWRVAVAIDGSDALHIAVSSPDTFSVYTNRTGSWTVDVLDSAAGGYGYGQPSLAVDAAGVRHVVYPLYWDPLVYATDASGVWETDMPFSAMRHASLALDSLDRPHIAWASGDVLHYLSCP